jgi:hypothetical protein
MNHSDEYHVNPHAAECCPGGRVSGSLSSGSGVGTFSKPLPVRLVKLHGFFADNRGRVYRHVGESIPDENNRLGRQIIGAPVVPGPAVFFRKNQHVRKVELPE